MLKRLADATIFANSPEVNRDQASNDKRDGHTVQNIKTIQRRLTHEATSEQYEFGVTARRNQVVATEVQELIAWSLTSQYGMSARRLVGPTAINSQ
jgi:hypothetical protein